MSETPYINGGVSFGRRSNAEISSAYNTPTYITP